MSSRFSLEAVFGGKDNLSKVVGKISTNYSRMANRMGADARKIAALNDKIVGSVENIAHKAIEAGLAFAGIGAGLELAEIAHEGIQTEAAISKLGSVTMRTAEQISELSEKAKGLGAQGKFAAAEIMGAMEMMSRASMTDEQIVESIDNIAAAAKIDRIEIEESSKLIVGAVKAMGGAGPEMGKHVNEMADMLVIARDHTTASMSDIVSAIDSVAPVARQLNIPVAQVTASIVGLTNAGLDAGSAGQALSTMFIKLSKLTPKMSAQLSAMGVKFTDAHGDMLPMNDVLTNIAKRMQKAGGNLKEMGELAEMVGGKGTKAALALEEFFKSGDMEKLTEALENSGGAAKKTSALISDNIGGDLSKIQARVRGFSEELFDLGSGPLRDITSGTLKWIDANKEMVKGKIVEYIHDIAEAMPKIADRIERLWPLVKFLGELSLAVWGVTRAVKAYQFVAALAKKDPYLLALEATLVAATLLVEYWPEIKQFFSDHQVAIAAVGGALGALAVAIYGPAGINAALGAIKLASEGAQAALSGMNSISFAGLLGALGPVGIAVAAIAASLATVYNLWKLNKETEGAGVTGTIENMITYGTWDPAKATQRVPGRPGQRTRRQCSPSSPTSRGSPDRRWRHYEHEQ